MLAGFSFQVSNHNGLLIRFQPGSVVHAETYGPCGTSRAGYHMGFLASVLLRWSGA